MKAKLDLTLLENGNPVNAGAHALYSLMKNQGAKFDLSVGGKINIKEYVEKDNESFINIKEFAAHEGSVVMVGAVEGSKITKVFSQEESFEEEEKIENNNNGGTEMNEEKIIALFQSLENKMLSAETEKQIGEFKSEFEGFKAEFSTLSEELKAEFSTRMEEINDIAKKLENGYTASAEELGAASEMLVILNAAEKNGTGLSCFAPGQEINVKESFANLQSYETFAASTTSLPSTIKPTYITKILERIQEANPFLRRISFMPITDNSLQIPREVLGLPTCLWVGETDTRNETDGVDLEDIDIKLYQLYCMPVVTNKLLATNFVGFLPFLLKRTEYAFGLKLADTIMNGDGVKKPLGILQDPAVTQAIDFDLSTGGAELVDSAFADKILETYYSTRSEIAEKAIWYMRRTSWSKIAKLKNTQKAFYITDLNTGNKRTLMSRPVEIVESDGSGLVPIATAVDGDIWGLFCDEESGIQAIVNNGLNIKITDNITGKGFTKYYMEKLLGAGVQLPETFVKLTVTKDE